MPNLTKNQLGDLRQLKQYCDELHADLVIIGAVAYQVHFPNESRHTADVDLAVALDLDDFAQLEKNLAAAKWARVHNHEHRWRSNHGTILDLIPAGPKLREAGQVTWPISKFTMSLVGFDHVFELAEPVDFGDDLTLRVIPPVVLMLLKIVAFQDDPNRRAKDLPDIRSLLQRYKEDSDLLFGDEIIEADLSDFSLAPAFLMGMHLRQLCTAEETTLVLNFFENLDEIKPAWMPFVRARAFGDDPEKEAHAQLKAFRAGFERARPAA
jgi:predicted nucleotidyltransferase